MLKRGKGKHVVVKRRRTQQVQAATISLFEKKLFIETEVFKQAIMCPFLSRRDLVAMIRTCKAGIIAMYALTADTASRHGRGIYIEWRLQRLLLNLETNPFWTQHPERLAYVRTLAINVDVPSLPPGLVGVKELLIEVPYSSKSAFPPGVKWVVTHDHFKFEGLHSSSTFVSSMPSTITTMDFRRRVTEFSEADPLPPNIIQLTVSEYFHELRPKVLPPELKFLTIDNYVPAHPSVGGYLQPGVLPSTLEQLKIGGPFNVVKGALHTGSLKHVEFRKYFTQQLQPGMLPHGLKVLQFEEYDWPIEYDVLPASVEVLIFRYTLKVALHPHLLPPGLQKLTIGDRFNFPLEYGVFPSTLKELRIGNHFNQPLEPGVLPPGLKVLKLGKHYQQPIDFSKEAKVIPYGLQFFRLGKSTPSHRLDRGNAERQYSADMRRLRPEIMHNLAPAS